MQELLVICIVAAAVIFLVLRYKPVVAQAFKKNRNHPDHHHADDQGCDACCGGCSCHASNHSSNHQSPGADA